MLHRKVKKTYLGEDKGPSSMLQKDGFHILDNLKTCEKFLLFSNCLRRNIVERQDAIVERKSSSSSSSIFTTT